MKILQISTYYLPHFGGIEQLVYDFSRILQKQGHKTKVICFNEGCNTVIDEYEGQEIVRVGYCKKIASQAISFSYFFKLKKLINEFDPDVIHLHLPNPLISLYLLLCRPKCHVTIHWHSDIVRQEKLHKLYAPIEKKIVERAEKIAATTKIYAENSSVIQGMMGKVSVIPSIIEEQVLNDTGDELKQKVLELTERFKNKKIIFTCGVHREYKGLKYLVEAAKYLPSEYAVVIAGTGPLSKNLKEQAKSACLENIIFTGRISDLEKTAYLKITDVFAFPSITKNEAFGIALCEALYMGIPAVTFTIQGSGVNYVNQNGVTGIEVSEHDAKLYADALLEASKNREKYSVAAHKWADEHFTEKAITENVRIFFTEWQVRI